VRWLCAQSTCAKKEIFVSFFGFLYFFHLPSRLLRNFIRKEIASRGNERRDFEIKEKISARKHGDCHSANWRIAMTAKRGGSAGRLEISSRKKKSKRYQSFSSCKVIK